MVFFSAPEQLFLDAFVAVQLVLLSVVKLRVEDGLQPSADGAQEGSINGPFRDLVGEHAIRKPSSKLQLLRSRACMQVGLA